VRSWGTNNLPPHAAATPPEVATHKKSTANTRTDLRQLISPLWPARKRLVTSPTVVPSPSARSGRAIPAAGCHHHPQPTTTSPAAAASKAGSTMNQDHLSPDGRPAPTQASVDSSPTQHGTAPAQFRTKQY